jgi:hypothetical protein
VRDVGFLVWVVLLFVGVLGSIVSNVRKQAQRTGTPTAVRPAPTQTPRAREGPVMGITAQGPQPGELPQWLDRMLQVSAPPPAPPTAQKRVAPKPVAPKPELPQPLVGEHHAVRARPLFDFRRDLVRAVIAAEVLGKPRGLADEYPFR